MRSIDNIIVIGSGNWGLALGVLFSRTKPVRIWCVDQAKTDKLNAHRDAAG